MDQTFGIEGVVVNDQELSLQLLLDLWNSIEDVYKRQFLNFLSAQFQLILHQPVVIALPGNEFFEMCIRDRVCSLPTRLL